MHPPGVMRPPPGYRQQPPPSSRQLLGNFYDDEDTSPERGQGRQLMAGDGRSMTLITPDTFTVLPPLTPPQEPVIRPQAPVVKPSQNAPSRTQASSRPFSTNSPPYRRGRKASFVILTAQDPRLPGSASSSRNVSPERPSFGPGLAPNQTQRKPSRIPRSQPVSREPSPTRRRSLGNLQRRGSLSPIKHTAASLKRLQVARSRPSSPKVQHRQPPARRPSKRFVQNNQPDSPSKIPVVNKTKEVNNNNNKQQQPKKTSVTETKKQPDSRNHSQPSAGAKSQSHSAPESKKDAQSASESKSQTSSTTEPKKQQPQAKKTSLNGTNRQSTVFRKNSNLHPVAGKPPLPPGAGRGRAGAKNSTSTKPGPGVGRGRKESDTRVLINPTMASAPASTDTPATNSRPPGDQTTTTTSTTSATSGLAPSAGASIVSITTHPALELAGEVAVTAAAQPAGQDPAPGPATASGSKTNDDPKSSNTSSGKDVKPSEDKGGTMVKAAVTTAKAAAATTTTTTAATTKSATTKSAHAKPTSVKSSAASKKTEPEAAAGTGVDGAAGGEEAAVTEAIGASLESVRTATSDTTIRAASSPRPKKKSTETEATSEAVIQGEPDLETLSANVKQAALPEPNTGGSTSTQPPPEPVKQKGGILARLCLRDAGGMKECCRRCCCCCCRKGGNAAAAAAAGDRRKSNATTTTSKKQSRSSSTAVEPDTRPKLDPSLMEHGSLIRSAIPVLPLPLAWICLIFNVLVPGIGTISSGLFCLCFGKPRLTQRDDPQGRISTFILNIFVSALQMFTVVFCFVGWGWSIWWGIIMVKISRKYRKLKRAEAASQRVENQLVTPATVQQNHDPERGVP